MGKIRILLAEDHVVVRESIRQLLERESDLEVVGEASNGEEAVRLTTQLKPDVVLMDVAMPHVNGIEATKRIKTLCPATAVVALTAYDYDQYLQQVTRAQEEERKRIARELHDETAQSLIAVSHQLENFASNNKHLSAGDIGLLSNLREQVKNALEGVRRFSRDLRPPILDDLGLLPAVEWLIGDLREQRGTKANLRVVGAQRRLAPEAELLLFRIIQEAVNNAKRHAEPSEVEVILEFGEGKMVATVRDNGKGFELPRTLGELSRVGKLGLAGMEERARLLGGSLTVQSEPDKGTTVVVSAPVQVD